MPRLGPLTPDLAPFHNPQSLGDLLPLGLPPRPSLAARLEELDFVSLDCETTGHFPHRMVELGAVRFRLGDETGPPQPRVSLESLVHCFDHINPYARRVHGITSSMLGGAPPLNLVASAFADLARGAVLIEHSADGFDTRLMSRALGRPLDNHHLDTSRLAGFLFQLRDTIGLERLCQRLGVDHRHPHYALADSEATADCFVRLVRLGQEEFGWRTLADLVEIAMPLPPRLVASAKEQRRHRGPSGSGRTPGAPAAADASSNGRRRHRGGRGRQRQTRDPEAPELAVLPSPEEAAPQI